MTCQSEKDRLLRQIAALDEREKEMRRSEWQTFYDQMMTPLPQDQELTNFFANMRRQELGTGGEEGAGQ